MFQLTFLLGDHVDCGIQPGLLACDFCLGDWPRPGPECLPDRTDRGEPRQQRHQGHTRNSQPVKTRLEEAILVLEALGDGGALWQDGADGPEAEKKGRVAGHLQNPRQTEATLLCAMEFVAGL